MATVARRSGRYTFDDFLAIVQEDQKADLIDGVIYLASPESTEDNDLVGWLYALMRDFVDELDLGKMYVSRVAFRLGSLHGPEPDLAFVAKRNLHRVHRGFVQGPPDIAVEIVSPESVDRDYVRKRALFERAGVREYWIIDPDERRATFLRRHRGKFREIDLEETLFESSALPGFKLDTRWFWSSRRPPVWRILREMFPDR